MVLGFLLMSRKEPGMGVPSYRRKDRESEFPPTEEKIGNRSSLLQKKRSGIGVPSYWERYE